MSLISTERTTRVADFVRWGADAQGSTRPLGLMRIAIATIVFVRFANEVSLYQGASLSFVLLGLVFFGLTSMMLVGYMAQAACAGVALTLMTMHFYMGHISGYPGWASHHIYILIVSVSLLALSPCGRSFSWDRYRALAQAQDARDVPPEYGDLWPQRLIALQLAALYFWAAVDKTNWSFLSGERLEQAFTWSYTGRALEPLISSARSCLCWPSLWSWWNIFWRSPSSCAAGRRSSCRSALRCMRRSMCCCRSTPIQRP